MGRWIAIASAATIAVATLRPGQPSPDLDSICLRLICGPVGGVDAALNLLLFAPLGLGFALARIRAGRAITAMCAYTLVIEVVQLLGLTGRNASIGDVITNSLGGFLGFVAGRYMSSLVRPHAAAATLLAAGWLTMWLGAQALAAYALIPVLPDPPYYGQIDRPKGHSRVEFPGAVLKASIGPELLTKGELRNAASLKTLLARPDGAPSEVTVLPAGITHGRGEIVVVSGPRMIGVMSLEQDGLDLIFGLRTGAEALRLRPIEFRLRGVFDQSSRPEVRDTVLLHARYGRSTVTVGAASRTQAQQQQFVPRLSEGWRLLMPFSTYIDGDAIDSFASATFLLLLILPAGYWAYFGRRTNGGSARVGHYDWWVVAFVIVFVAGLVVVPIAFVLRPAAGWEWAFVIFGTLVGAAFARRVSGSNSR